MACLGDVGSLQETGGSVSTTGKSGYQEAEQEQHLSGPKADVQGVDHLASLE